jgi:hypothetical protein
MTILMAKQKTMLMLLTVTLCAVLLSTLPLEAQQTGAPSSSATALPRLVRFNGTAKDPNGNPLTGVVGTTFALYSEQNGGASLWLETQNVRADANGHYTCSSWREQGRWLAHRSFHLRAGPMGWSANFRAN